MVKYPGGGGGKESFVAAQQVLQLTLWFVQGVSLECTAVVCVPDGVAHCEAAAVVPAGREAPSHVDLAYTYRLGVDPTHAYT